MPETADVQGTVIGVGTLVAVAFLGYGTLVADSIAGIDMVAAAAWTFAATLAVVAGLHAWVGQYDLTWGFGGAAAGWLFVLLGEGVRVLLGLLLLVVSGAYVALVTIRLRRREPSIDGDRTIESEATGAGETDPRE